MRVDLARHRRLGAHRSGIAVPRGPTGGIPVTYVPARNTLFLSLALGWAEVLGARDIFIGVNAVDYSGYPDCRPEFIAAFEQLAQSRDARRRRGRALQRARAADRLEQGATSSAPACGSAWTTRSTVSCYQADAQGPGLRPLRFLPAAARRVRARRACRIRPAIAEATVAFRYHAGPSGTGR